MVGGSNCATGEVSRESIHLNRHRAGAFSRDRKTGFKSHDDSRRPAVNNNDERFARGKSMSSSKPHVTPRRAAPRRAVRPAHRSHAREFVRYALAHPHAHTRDEGKHARARALTHARTEPERAGGWSRVHVCGPRYIQVGHIHIGRRYRLFYPCGTRPGAPALRASGPLAASRRLV